jgi:hypothetical protein
MEHRLNNIIAEFEEDGLGNNESDCSIVVVAVVFSTLRCKWPGSAMQQYYHGKGMYGMSGYKGHI